MSIWINLEILVISEFPLASLVNLGFQVLTKWVQVIINHQYGPFAHVMEMGKNWLKDTSVKHNVVNRHNFPNWTSFSYSVTVWKVSILGIFPVHIFLHLGWIQREIQTISSYLAQLQENTGQKNSEYRQFSQCDYQPLPEEQQHKTM